MFKPISSWYMLVQSSEYPLSNRKSMRSETISDWLEMGAMNILG